MNTLRKILTVVILLAGFAVSAQTIMVPPAPSEKRAKEVAKMEKHDLKKRDGVKTKDPALKPNSASKSGMDDKTRYKKVKKVKKV